jgi:malonate transporter and related proteins
MSEAISALVPVFALIALGFAARRSGLVGAEAWGAANRLGYLLFYPAFLFTTIAGADFGGADALPFLLVLLAAFGSMGALLLLVRPLLGPDGPAFTSVFQAGSRWHGFIIVAAAPALWGPQGTALVALAFGPLVAFVNVMCVLVLARWGSGAVAPGLRGVVRELVRNPLILGCAAGLVVNLAGAAPLLGLMLDATRIRGGAAMPVALVCVGAALSFEGFGRVPGHLVAGAAAKLVVLPTLALGWGLLAGLPALPLAVAIGVAATPTAAASYMLAREMGGDAPLMAALVSLTTVLAGLTMPVWLSAFQGA